MSMLLSLLMPAPYVEPEPVERHVNYGKALPLVRAAIQKLGRAGTNKLAEDTGVSVRRVRYAMAALEEEGFVVLAQAGCNKGNFKQAIWELAK